MRRWLAVSLLVHAQPCLHLIEELSGDDGRDLDRDPLRGIAVQPLAPDQLLVLPVAVLYARHPIEVPDSRIRLILQHRFNTVVVPPGLSAARWDPVAFKVSNDRDESKIAAR